MLSDFKYALYQHIQTIYVGTGILRTRRLKFQKQHPDFSDTMKVWFFFFFFRGKVRVAGITQDCSPVACSLNVALPLLQCLLQKGSLAPFQTPQWNNPGGAFEGEHDLHTIRHFTELRLKSAASLYIFKQSQPAMPNYLLPKAFG